LELRQPSPGADESNQQSHEHYAVNHRKRAPRNIPVDGWETIPGGFRRTGGSSGGLIPAACRVVTGRSWDRGGKLPRVCHVIVERDRTQGGQNGNADGWQGPDCDGQSEEGQDAPSLPEHTIPRPASPRQREDPRDQCQNQRGFAPEHKNEYFKACHGIHLDEQRLEGS
jgi:hypothetical protein